MLYPDAFAVGTILTKRRISIHRRILRHTKYELWTRQIKIVGGRKSEKKKKKKKTYKSNSKCHKEVAQGLPVWVCPCAYPQVLHSFSSYYFTCCTTFCLVGIFFHKAEGPGPFVTDHRSSGWDLLLSLPSLSPNLWLGTQALLQAIAGQGHPRSYLFKSSRIFYNPQLLSLENSFLPLQTVHTEARVV